MTPATDIQQDTLDLAERLIACRSLTPDDGGALDMIAARLTQAGFACERIDRGPVRNLWARRGSAAPLICLAGHVDVVPPGPVDRWTSDPFSPTRRDGRLFGRGAADMKVSVAALVTAVERFVDREPNHRGSLALLFTSDEEGAGIDGTAAVVRELQARGDRIDACLIGEPTSVERLGDTIKNGRRGSLNGVLRVNGIQCHIAYPERGRNPVQAALPALAELAATEWDRGNDYFAPTSFQISDIHAGTGANNIIPGSLDVMFNFRFSTESTADQLQARVHAVLDAHRLDHEVKWSLSGVTPALSTSGGTSDGRFLAAVSREVVEFGPLSASIHGIDEHVLIADIGPLSEVYERTLATLLADASRERSA
jgi:succinyl-diaminopimelate desuccinylase